MPAHSDAAKAHVFVPQILLCYSLDVIRSDGIDISFNLLWCVSLSGGDHLSANLAVLAVELFEKLGITHVLSNSGCSVQTEQ